ncbi:MAG: pilus assembly protein [Planctomycetales bacterium]|nr:pilus assembly protein [Planctomycetales bacterium]
MKIQTKRQLGHARRGLSTVELAVCLPVITLIVFASIEACSLVFLQQSLQTTAYETARFAVAPNSVSSTAIDRGSQIITDRRIKSATIELDPKNMEKTDPGTLVVARVTAPLNSNRLIPAFFYGDQQLTAEVTMMKE